MKVLWYSCWIETVVVGVVGVESICSLTWLLSLLFVALLCHALMLVDDEPTFNAGGLNKLATMPACNIQVLGS